MKVILIFVFSFVLVNSISAAEKIILKSNSSKIDFGLLSSKNEVDGAMNKSFVFKRDKNSPPTVKITYQIHTIKKKCVDYRVEVLDKPDITQRECIEIGDTKYQCEDKTHRELYTARTVCLSKGFVQETVDKSFKISFKKAAVLAENSVEEFEVNLKQKDYDSTSVTLKGRVVDSAVSYKVSKSFGRNLVSFKALR